MSSRYKTKAEREYLNKIAQLPCVVCGDWPVDVHHALTGMGRRKNHMQVLPLCFLHHRGTLGIGTLGKKAWEAMFGTQKELLERLKQWL